MSGTMVLALGGNALIQPGEEGTVDQQAVRAREVAASLASLDASTRLVVTHGNGPQVGRALLRSDLCAAEIPPTPLDVAVAGTCGEIGTMLAQALTETMARPVCDVLTHVDVDLADPAFLDPRKFIGSFYSREDAEQRAMEFCWSIREDTGRGWRRVVASPEPKRIVELAAIRTLLDAGQVVIACGGGGVPVRPLGTGWIGVEAVIDKDLASAFLAAELGADAFVIVTGVDEVAVDWGTPSARALRDTRADEIRAWLAAGQFPPGSMGPKVAAALSFLDAGGTEVLITSPECLPEALAGGRGTRITR
ncbi:MAG: carbamate kinase [Proteobacteria bacterium]|nr:carbamate kinase [Pseudomonadota bacterium]